MARGRVRAASLGYRMAFLGWSTSESQWNERRRQRETERERERRSAGKGNESGVEERSRGEEELEKGWVRN